MFNRFYLISFILFLLSGLLGCVTSEYNLATRKQELYIYSTEKEQVMGYNLSKEVEKEFKVLDDSFVQERVNQIGQRIAEVCDRKDLRYHFKVLKVDEVNAFALPGGYVYVFKGMLDKIGDDDDELAGILAHEVAHITARHAIKKLQAMWGYMLARVLVASTPQTGNVGQGIDVAFNQILLGYSKEDEYQADKLGAKYMLKAGYNPDKMIALLNRLHKINQRGPTRPFSYDRTHPFTSERIAAVKHAMGKGVDFDDYLNLEAMPGRVSQ
ncbi:MAG: M48 family metallopeptidase [Candidatus Omnitrophota bacterium]